MADGIDSRVRIVALHEDSWQVVFGIADDAQRPIRAVVTPHAIATNRLKGPAGSEKA